MELKNLKKIQKMQLDFTFCKQGEESILSRDLEKLLKNELSNGTNMPQEKIK